MLVLLGVPAIPGVLVMLEGADLEGRWALISTLLHWCQILLIVTRHDYFYDIINLTRYTIITVLINPLNYVTIIMLFPG